MTNPNSAVGTNAAYGGRTSVNAFNDVLGAFTSGILSGWACSPDTGLTVVLGGNGTTRDVAIAEDNSGNKTTINNISGSPISVTIPAAPASNSRIDLIVAYVDNPPEGVDTTADNPAACGLIVVSGTPASTPLAPDDNAIRTAITADGASGSNAYYVALAAITIASGTTTLVATNISQPYNVNLQASIPANSIQTSNIQNAAITEDKIDYSSLPVFSGYKDDVAVGTSYTDFFTYTIPSTGIYFISSTCNLQSVSSGHTAYLTIKKGGTGVDSCYQAIEANSFGNLTYNYAFAFDAGDIVAISLQDTVGISKNVNTRLRCTIFRIK